MSRTVIVMGLIALGVAAGIPGSLAAQSYKVETVSAAPPAELAPAVREMLSGEAMRVTGPDGVLCEIWLRKSIPAQTPPSTELGVGYARIAEGALFGVIRFPADRRDYRRQKVAAGVYTLRYAILPQNGDHMGVSPNRDYVLAAPASADTDPANVSHDQAVELAKKTTGTKHPSVWYLADPAGNAAPGTIVHIEDGNLWALQFRATIGGAPVPMALIVVGSAPEA